MSCFETDNVKAEKADALWRYKMEKKFRVGLRLTEFFLALFLLSWSWFPTVIPGTLQIARDISHCFVSTFNEPLYTFVLLNFIIAVVYILSSQKQTQKQAMPHCTDIYDEYVGSSRRSIPTFAVFIDAEEGIVDKQFVHVENAVPLFPVKQLETTIHTLSIPFLSVKQPKTTMKRTVNSKTKAGACSTQVKEKEYRRTTSVVSESITQRPVEFRRSETAIRGGEHSMDDISSEEFQLIIDSFIAERKKNLQQENTAHYASRKHNCTAYLF